MSPDPQITAWLDQMDQLTIDNIRHHGVHLEHVLGDCANERASFSYTVGLFGIGHPELLIFGCDLHTNASVLSHLATEVRAGRRLMPAEEVTFPDWPHRAVVETCPNPGQILFAANRHYQRPDEASVPVLQLTTDDRDGRFPWEEGYSVPAHVQPRPGTFAA